jgi:hypothetical protein
MTVATTDVNKEILFSLNTHGFGGSSESGGGLFLLFDDGVAKLPELVISPRV